VVVHLIDCYNVEVNGKILFSSVHYLTKVMGPDRSPVYNPERNVFSELCTVLVQR